MKSRVRLEAPGTWVQEAWSVRKSSLVPVLLLAFALPAVAADMAKTLHVAFVAPENGFDPQAASDLYSNYVNREIFDPLYRYDYLARPFKVVPNTAAALPEISADGLTWTIKVRPGIYFTDDPAFKGKKRELTAADYVYGWKRLIDPRLRSINAQIFDDRLAGADALALGRGSVAAVRRLPGGHDGLSVRSVARELRRWREK